MDDKFIDIERIITSKNPKLLKWIPSFLMNYIKKTVHQDDINDFLLSNRSVFGNEFCSTVIEHFEINVKASGLENIPKEGGAIFVVNHPLGGMDAMAIVHEVQKVRKDIKFIVNDILLNLKNLKGLFVGVNKHSANSKESLQEVNDLFASDKAVFVFPAGLVSRKSKGEVRDLEWKKTFVTRAKKFEQPVIPVFLDGELTKFFYGLANVRKNIGIKANIEMLYLAQEMFKQRNKTINLIFGEPIDARTYDKSKTDKEWAQWTKEKVYSLKK